MEDIDPQLAEVLAALDADVEPAWLAYRNDFSSPKTQGRSDGPAGQGPLAADADSMVAFGYGVVVDTLADGTRAARFPTGVEQPGGAGYSWFGAYVCGRREFVEGVSVWGFTVHVPARVELAERCRYYENRFVAAAGQEDVANIVGVRFDGPEELVWVHGQGADARVLDRLPLGARLIGGERLRFAFAVDIERGRAALGVRCAERGIDVASAAPTVVDLAGANAIVVSSSGNGLASDDLDHFFRLSDVVAYRAARRA